MSFLQGLFGPPDVAKLAAKRDVPGLITALEYKKDARIRLAAVEALGKLGDISNAEALLARTSDPSSEVRCAALVALRELRYPHIREVLEQALTFGDAVTAANELAQLGDKDAIPVLVAALTAWNPLQCGPIVAALDRLGWQPTANAAGASYYIAKCEWDKCVAVGAAAIEPLASLLVSKHVNAQTRTEVAHALASLGDVRAVQPLADAALRRMPQEAAAAVKILVSAGGPILDEATSVFIKELNTPSSQMTVAAARALALIPTQRAVDALASARGSGDRTGEVVRQAHAEASRRLGTMQREATIAALTRRGGPDDVHQLVDLLGDPDWHVRQAAATRLGAIGDTRAVEPLISVLELTDWYLLKVSVAKALGDIGDSRAARPLIAALKDREREVQTTAAYALGRIGAPAAEPLVAALQDGSLREATAELLGAIGAPAVEPLIVGLKHHDREMRRAAVRVLQQIGDARAVDPLIAALGDGDAEVRLAAAGALGALGDARAVEPLIAALRDDESVVRLAAAGAVSIIGDERSVEPLIAALGDDDNDVRLVAADRLGVIGDTRTIEPLSAALIDDDKRVRRAAAGALGLLGYIHTVEPLIAALADSDRLVRQAAANALKRIFHSTELDEPTRSLIVAQRTTTARPHVDHLVHHDGHSCDGDHNDYVSHTDWGIGVEL